LGETNKIIGVHRAPSTYIFHGPGAFEAAVSHAESWGRQLCPPLGGSGVRKDDSRTFAALHRNPPVSDQAGCVIIGPMDAATDEASDALLKMVEEPNPDAMPILWAADLGGVRPTIRSRCHAEWCPGAVDIAEPPGLLSADPAELAATILGGDPVDLAAGIAADIAHAAASDPDAFLADPRWSDAWSRLRPCLGRESKASVAHALLGGPR
jgi:hypothetical protein